MNNTDIETELTSLLEREAKLKQLLELRASVARLEWKALSETKEHTCIKMIVEEVCSELKIPVEKLMSTSRVENIARSRQIVFFLARALKEIPFDHIGKVFNRDHCTVMHGCNRVQALSETDIFFAGTVSGLMARCEKRLSTEPPMSENVHV